MGTTKKQQGIIERAKAAGVGFSASDPKPMIVYCCTKCGGRNVSLDASARWDEIAQEWSLSGTQDQAYCDDCGGETSLREEPLDEPPEGDLTAEQLAKLDAEDAANGIGHLAEKQCADWPQCACGSGGPDHCNDDAAIHTFGKDHYDRNFGRTDR